MWRLKQKVLKLHIIRCSIIECFYHLYPSASDSGDWSHLLKKGYKLIGFIDNKR